MSSILKHPWTAWMMGLFAICWLGCDSPTGDVPPAAPEEKAVVKVDSTPVKIHEMVAEELKIDTAAWAAFPKKWLGLERSKTGYVVYRPCDGTTPAIDLDSLKLKIDGQWHDGEIAFSIRSFQKINENEYQLISANEWGKVQLKMRLVRPASNLWLFSGWVIEENGEYPLRWVMTTKASSKKFPVVKNPCPTEKIPEKEFLPIEF